MMYRDCEISVDPKPIGDRSHDWDWCHKDYCGPDDYLDVQLYGTAESEKACHEAIDEMHEEMQSEQQAQDFQDEMRAGMFDRKPE
tara:strand:+ start:11566 stop:11820 length:255 start_codon:yes stop_codon:yes gene_type:complete